jgi:heterodisulfide reductase subunit C
MSKITAEEIKEISGTNPRKCMKCGKCSASCPAFDEMDIKPHMFVSYVESGDIEALLASKAAYRCLSCFACLERCPRDVQPAKVIDAVRQAVIRRNSMDYLKADDIPEKIDSDTPQQLLVSAFRRWKR